MTTSDRKLWLRKVIPIINFIHRKGNSENNKKYKIPSSYVWNEDESSAKLTLFVRVVEIIVNHNMKLCKKFSNQPMMMMVIYVMTYECQYSLLNAAEEVV